MKCGACGGTGRVADPRAVGAELRQLRVAAGLTLRAVARELGLSAPYICDLEHGRRRWSPELKQRYLRAVAGQ